MNEHNEIEIVLKTDIQGRPAWEWSKRPKYKPRYAVSINGAHPTLCDAVAFDTTGVAFSYYDYSGDGDRRLTVVPHSEIETIEIHKVETSIEKPVLIGDQPVAYRLDTSGRWMEDTPPSFPPDRDESQNMLTKCRDVLKDVLEAAKPAIEIVKLVHKDPNLDPEIKERINDILMSEWVQRNDIVEESTIDLHKNHEFIPYKSDE